MLRDLVEILERHLRIAQNDALLAAAFALIGFGFASYTHLDPTKMICLAAVSGFLVSRLSKQTSWYLSWSLRYIDKLESDGHITHEHAVVVKKKLVDQWITDTHETSRIRNDFDKENSEA